MLLIILSPNFENYLKNLVLLLMLLHLLPCKHLRCWSVSLTHENEIITVYFLNNLFHVSLPSIMTLNGTFGISRRPFGVLQDTPNDLFQHQNHWIALHARFSFTENPQLNLPKKWDPKPLPTFCQNVKIVLTFKVPLHVHETFFYNNSYNITVSSTVRGFAGGGGGILPVMSYTETLHPEGVPFSGFSYMKEKGFFSWKYMKG